MRQPIQIGSMMPTLHDRSVMSHTQGLCERSSQALAPAVLRCISRYGSGENFLLVFNPSHQYEYTKDLQRVYMGDAPNLGVLGKAFGSNIPVAWLVAQIRDISEFAGVKEKLDGDKAKRLAEVIAHKWPYLKTTELMLFFLRFKSGDYGRFYGYVDPMLITEALRKFAIERVSEIAKIEEEMRPEKERLAKEERLRFEDRLLKALKPWNMTPYEYFLIDDIYGVTVEDIEEFGWLFRL